MKFVGRSNEISKLRPILESNEANIALIYGRRRVGKSRLIEEACKHNKVFNFEGLETGGKKDQIKNFLFQIEIQTGKEIERKSDISSWTVAFSKLLPFLKDHPSSVIVLDEFQWMANYRSNLVSELKMLFDQYISKVPGVTLILCGSIASFMVKKVLRSKALYGRIDLNIHLKEFHLNEVQEFLPKHSKEDVLLAYFMLGGIPKYLSYIAAGESIPLAIQKLFFDENPILREEFDKIFISHFGQNDSYSEILRLLKDKRLGLSHAKIHDGTSSSGGGQTTRELFNLEMAGFIETVVPFDKKLSSTYKRFLLTDSFCSFFLNFVEPSLLSKKRVSFFNEVFQSPAFKSWTGLAFEIACLKHRDEIAKALGFSGISYRAAPYWGNRTKKTPQFDLVFDRNDKVITVCEVKFKDSAIPLSVGEKLHTQIASLSSLRNKTVQRVLISKSLPTAELRRSSYFNEILGPDVLFLGMAGGDSWS